MIEAFIIDATQARQRREAKSARPALRLPLPNPEEPRQEHEPESSIQIPAPSTPSTQDLPC